MNRGRIESVGLTACAWFLMVVGVVAIIVLVLA